MKMIAEAPLSPAPTRRRGNSMKFAPTKAAQAPTAVATEFIVTTCSRGTTCGSDAESPDATNRDRPLATSAAEQQRYVAGPDGQDGADRGDENQPPHVGADDHQPSIPTVHQRAGERSQQRVRQEQHGECPGDGQGVGGTIRVEQQRPGQPGLEETITELTRHAQLQQPPEIRQTAHRPPQVDVCARVHPGMESQNRLPRLGWRAEPHG